MGGDDKNREGVIIAGRSFLSGDGPFFVGVINVTPDSFSDGGRFLDPEKAADRAADLVREGADLLDVGGESTRPGSDPVGEDEELDRVLPAIRAIRKRTERPVSIDTTKPRVAAEAVREGAAMINDVSMLRRNPGLAEVAARCGVPLVLMHSRKTPRDMQEGDVTYNDVVADVTTELRGAIATAVRSGVAEDRILVDPGIGFSKTVDHNLALIARLDEIKTLGRPVMIGPSRKSFIGAMTGAPASERIGGTAASVSFAVLAGADFVRVHDVAIMRQAGLVARRLANAREKRGA